jgi:methyl-accepting chemotaxis protein
MKQRIGRVLRQVSGMERLSIVVDRLGIAGRMALAIGLVLALFTSGTAFALWQISLMQRGMVSALDASSEMAGQAVQMRSSVDRIYLGATLLVLSTHKGEAEYFRADIAKARSLYASARQTLNAIAQTDSDAKPLAEALENLAALETVDAEIDRELARRISSLEGAAEDTDVDLDMGLIAHMAGSAKNQFERWSRAVDEVVLRTASIAGDREAKATATALFARNVQLLSTAVGLLVGAVGSWLIARSIAVPLQNAVGIAQTVAQGRLTAHVPAGGHGETGALLRALGCMQDSLRELVRDVRDSARSIQISAEEVAAGNTDLSQRSERAASHLQRTTGSMQQLSGAAQRSAEAAATAEQLAKAAATAAKQGGEVVQQVVQGMGTITLQARKIGEISGAIDGIAFQTNILALNAAVEAARAGEQGRGFAVVASEVRQLAHRAAVAAKDIKTLSGESVRSVVSGEALAQDAGKTMDEIVASVRQVSAVMGEITDTSASQSVGIGDVSEAMKGIDHMTQQNAALVVQGAASAESLRKQARRLSELVNSFVLEAS